MRLLFEMYHPGFLRNFETAIRLLAANGHDLVFVFEKKARLGEERLVDDLCRTFPNIRVEPAGKLPAGKWRQLAEELRSGGDYLRYLTPPYRDASALRVRARKRAPAWLARLADSRMMRTPGGLGLAMRLIATAERALPVPKPIEDRVRRIRPDLVVVTPLVGLGSGQVDIVKACRGLGVPSVLGVASWDNLTNKGVVRLHPDHVLVWNEPQKREAVALHGFAADSVTVCGAWTYDHWFEWQADLSRADFLGEVGLPPDSRYVLYVCSSPFIAPEEVGFVRTWIAALRGSGEPALAGAAILVRPHPQNAAQWADVDLSDRGPAAIWPRAGANPIDRDTRNDYFNSLYFSDAIVGINTSAQIEAGIIGRPVLTITDGRFAATQQGTLHFHHLTDVNGGLLSAAPTLEAHCRQLAAAMAGGESASEKSRRFIEAFVRPHGMAEPAAPRLVKAIEHLASQARPKPAAATPLVRVLRGLLASILALRPEPPAKASRKMAG